MRLTELIIRQAKFSDKPYKLFDGGGLYLHIMKNGKYRRYRYRYQGRDKILAIGVYPRIGLKEARNIHMTAKLQLKDGLDPNAGKHRKRIIQYAKQTCTFESIAREWHKVKQPEWSNMKHVQQVINTLKHYAFPLPGQLPMEDIDPVLVSEVLDAIGDKPETAKRVKQRICTVFDYAIQTGRAQNNPARVMPRRKGHHVNHHPALPENRISEFFVRLQDYPNRKIQSALQLLLLTFVRSGELRFGQWTEIQGNEWHIPAQRMKMRKAHIVPLSDWVQEISEELKYLNRFCSPYFITGIRNRPVSDSTLSAAMRRMGYGGIAVPHGFRSTASSILNESGLFNPDAIEKQLAHKINRESNHAVRAAYNRAEYLSERTKMMQWYADYIKSKITLT